MKSKSTRIKCPYCHGKGISPQLGLRCMWCGGKGRVSTSIAKQYADQVYMIAGGGYLDGTHNLSDMREMEAEAEAVYKSIKKTPPWQRSMPKRRRSA